MADWPSPEQHSVYAPPTAEAIPQSEADVRARIAGARIREGLPVTDELLSRILGEQRGSPRDRSGIFTVAERQDIGGDNERVAQARAVLADAEDVLGGLEVCWHNGVRAVRVLLTGEHERYRQLLSRVISPDRVVIDSVTLTDPELRDRMEQVMAQAAALADQGIFLTRHSVGVDGLAIDYLAAHQQRAQRVLEDRFGEFATIRYRGASNHTFRPSPFGSWLADADKLHVFYGLPQNGERPGSCQAFETERAVIVSLTILDWRGAKTLIGGFVPLHATVMLREPLGDRTVIDDSENRSRPHWTHA
jgi:hypothetical protein